MDAAVKLSQKDCFLPPALFRQLLTGAVGSLSSLRAVDLPVVLPPPAVLKPAPLYAGKQLFSVLMTMLVEHCRPPSTAAAAAAVAPGKGRPFRGLTTVNKAKTPEWAYGEASLEHKPLWSNGYLARGVLDKNAIGEPGGGLIHSVFEVRGRTRRQSTQSTLSPFHWGHPMHTPILMTAPNQLPTSL